MNFSSEKLLKFFYWDDCSFYRKWERKVKRLLNSDLFVVDMVIAVCYNNNVKLEWNDTVSFHPSSTFIGSEQVAEDMKNLAATERNCP